MLIHIKSIKAIDITLFAKRWQWIKTNWVLSFIELIRILKIAIKIHIPNMKTFHYYSFVRSDRFFIPERVINYQQGILMKKIIMLSLAFTAAYISTISFDIEAGNKYTKCNYEKIAGAPHEPNTRTKYFSGHVQCPETLVTGEGYHRLVSQLHLN